MDLVRELKEVRFELNLRGYDCEAVDAFLAQLRSDVATVQKDSTAAAERIAELESQVAAGGGGSSETEGTLRRTLVLAQRLADETEAESKQAAAELIDGATIESTDMRAAAEVEAQSMRAAGEAELAAARDEAELIREESNKEAAKSRAEARQQAAGILEEAEKRGAERVVVIEQAAQQAATDMREPIRAEVDELETVRSRLLSDVSELETHLEAQRVRVRTAVEALRIGMSGSIEDLERVAEDDELLATQPAPEHSGASGADVAIAPEIEIIDRVDETVPAAPTVDDVEDVAIANTVPITDDEIAAELPIVDEMPEIEVSEAPDTVDDTDLTVDDVEIAIEDSEDIEDVVVDAVPIVADEAPVVVIDPVDAADAVVVDAGVDNVPDLGPNTEPIPVVATIPDADLDEAEVVDLDVEPSGMFGTDVGEDADVDDSGADVLVLGGAVAGVTAAGATAAVALSDDEAPVQDAETGFVDRFSEALDVLPIARD